MSSFIDRWINRMNSNQSHNSRPSNTGKGVSYHTLQSRNTGNSQVYYRQQATVSTSPNNTNFPVSYFQQQQEGVIPKEDFEKMMMRPDDKEMLAMDAQRRKSSITSIESEE